MSFYKDLKVWQKAMDLCSEVYEFTTSKEFENERFGLVSQMRRASVSVTSNIAEGTSRSDKERTRFIDIALGSLAELDTQHIICQKVYKIDRGSITDLIIETRKMLYGLKKTLSAEA